MKTEDIIALIEKYYEGQTSLEEEETLRSYFSKKENHQTDPEFADIINMMNDFQQIIPEEEIEIESPKVSRQTVNVPQLPWYYAVAASITFLLIGLFIGNRFFGSSVEETTLAELRDEIGEIKAMVNSHQLASMSPAERIQVTYQARSMDSLDLESMNAIIDLMRFDENDNVRLSATEALMHFGNNDKVRGAFLKALKDEQNPLVQIKLIDAIVKSNQKNAIPELQKIITSDDENSAVKQRAAYGLSKLI